MLLRASCASTLEDCSFASHCFRALVTSFTVVLGRAGETNRSWGVGPSLPPPRCQGVFTTSFSLNHSPTTAGDAMPLPWEEEDEENHSWWPRRRRGGGGVRGLLTSVLNRFSNGSRKLASTPYPYPKETKLWWCWSLLLLPPAEEEEAEAFGGSGGGPPEEEEECGRKCDEEPWCCILNKCRRFREDCRCDSFSTLPPPILKGFPSLRARVSRTQAQASSSMRLSCSYTTDEEEEEEASNNKLLDSLQTLVPYHTQIAVLSSIRSRKNHTKALLYPPQTEEDTPKYQAIAATTPMRSTITASSRQESKRRGHLPQNKRSLKLARKCAVLKYHLLKC